MTPERINELRGSRLWGINNAAEIQELCDLALKGLAQQGYVNDGVVVPKEIAASVRAYADKIVLEHPTKALREHYERELGEFIFNNVRCFISNDFATQHNQGEKT